jgi:hypothetical protein
VTIGGKGLAKGVVELRRRRDGKVEELPLSEAAGQVSALIRRELEV